MFADREETWRLPSTWSSAEFTVDVEDAPMSRSIERAMADNVRHWLDDEQRFTERWLADH